MRMQIRIILLFALIFCASSAYAQDVEYARVKGRITSLSGYPAAGADVTFYELEGINGISTAEKLIRRVTTNKDGNYICEKLPLGQYRVEINAKFGWTEIWRFYIWRDSYRVLDVGVPVGYAHAFSQIKVSGVARQANGSPAANVTVTKRSAYEESDWEQVRTDNRGKYEFKEIQPGDYVLYFTKQGFLPAATTFRINFPTKSVEQKIPDIKLEAEPKSESLPKK
jgi:5-hydroxyisourate hydrolase-like protein (transthyretin family)